MAGFILYLVESGMCLTLLYLVYVLFFIKETYFNFNRIYLLSIMILSLIVPVVHVTIAVSSKDNIEKTFRDIGRFRSSYTEFIAMGVDEFGKVQYRDYPAAVFENDFLYGTSRNYELTNGVENNGGKIISTNNRIFNKVNFLKIFIAIYLMRVLAFFVRLAILLNWLNKTVKSNPRKNHKSYKLVLMEKEVPPFSFFRYIFVTNEATKLNEFEQVLAHEKVHVEQLHSFDLIFAHILTVFQWFNPLVWQLQKAIKTTHEYIADSKVVKQGFELFDYQSLLLSQLISIRSVELVNNFNLISIKKRIAMMTKNKSRFSAKLKALIVIPMALVTFVLFADMTVKSPILSFTNFNSAKVSNLDGIWENNSDTYGKLLLFKGDHLSILENANEVNVVDLPITIKDEKFQINRFGNSSEWLKYQLSGNELKVWWNDNEYSVYNKTDFKNSFEALTPKAAANFKLPQAEYAKILDRPDLVINVCVFPDKYLVDNVECKLDDLKDVINKRFYEFNRVELPFITTRIVVDKNTEMKPVYDLFQVLRNLYILRMAYGCFPVSGISELQFHYAGVMQMLPPVDAESLDRDEIKDRIIVIKPGGDLIAKEKEIENFIRNHPDYIAAYDWENTTKYGDYLGVVDMFYDVIYRLRNEYTKEKYKLLYTQLPDDLQKEVRKKLPMRLSQTNTDED